jgi:GntR family transcriptional repressor for pyruvate dehydrogenase complex
MARRAKAKTFEAALGPVEKEGVAQKVVNRILELVRTGLLCPGDRLPSERELIEIFSISRPSLREALQALSVLGVIESRHGGGGFVTDLEPHNLLAPLDFFLSLSSQNLADSIECRRVIEAEIVRKAALHATTADIAELQEMVAAHKKIMNDPIGFRILDSRFHEKLSSIAGNVMLERLSHAFYNMGLDIRRRATLNPRLIAQSTRDHIQIAEAIAARDPESAAAAMTTHLRHIEASTQKIMEQDAAEGAKPQSGKSKRGSD